MTDETPEDRPDRTPCPPWCDGVQCRQAMPEDRRHQAAEEFGVVREEVAYRDGQRAVYATGVDMHLVMFTNAVPKHDGASDDEIWFMLGAELFRDTFTLTVESAWRLWRVLGEMLKRVA